ncbi:hypothetical protein EYF80_008968 [Liparis tanakae]|uniref:Uncharacterized protein n=1 Tax=Liparis tanakae TaxID=230148 RepID=A0A4Z2IT93_9TELE|nr:hypothetical protein EYF80_008968 [Liparis tanakae]
MLELRTEVENVDLVLACGLVWWSEKLFATTKLGAKPQKDSSVPRYITTAAAQARKISSLNSAILDTMLSWVHVLELRVYRPPQAGRGYPMLTCLIVCLSQGPPMGGVWRVCGVDEADCACVSEAAVLLEEERVAVALRIRPARLVCLAL